MQAAAEVGTKFVTTDAKSGRTSSFGRSHRNDKQGTRFSLNFRFASKILYFKGKKDTERIIVQSDPLRMEISQKNM